MPADLGERALTKLCPRNPTEITRGSAPTSDEVGDPNDVRGLFQALTDGGCGGLMGPTEEKKPEETGPLK